MPEVKRGKLEPSRDRKGQFRCLLVRSRDFFFKVWVVEKPFCFCTLGARFRGRGSSGSHPEIGPKSVSQNHFDYMLFWRLVYAICQRLSSSQFRFRIWRRKKHVIFVCVFLMYFLQRAEEPPARVLQFIFVLLYKRISSFPHQNIGNQKEIRFAPLFIKRN